MKKFIKKNLFMIVFMFMALLAVAALLIMVYFEHQSMEEYDAKKTELLEKITKLVNQTHTPTKRNITLIKSDIFGYNKEIKKIQSKFGHPYASALKSFAETVGINLNDFKAKFGEFWESKKGHTTRDLIFHTYKVKQFRKDFPNHRSEWDTAMLAFMRKAQKVTLENIEVANVDGIFLAAMGKGRTFSDSQTSCQAFMKRMRFNMIDYFAKKKVNCATMDFSFDENKLPMQEDIEKIARAWEVIADLGKRIADAKVDPEKDALELISFSKRGLDGEKDGNYTMYRFSFTVNADLNTIRRIIKKLYEAYTENRVYAVRNIKLDRTVDNVAKILEESERIKEDLDYDTNKDGDSSSTKGKMRPSRPGASKRETDNTSPGRPRKRVKEKRKILTPKDRGYAKVIIGSNNICSVEFDVDYIVFDDSPK